MSEQLDYPWYRVVRGSDLEQGDLLFGAPRFVIPPEATVAEAEIIIEVIRPGEALRRLGVEE